MKTDFNMPPPARTNRYHARAVQVGTGHPLFYQADTLEELNVKLYGSAYPAERSSVAVYENNVQLPAQQFLADDKHFGTVLAAAIHDIPLDQAYKLKSESNVK